MQLLINDTVFDLRPDGAHVHFVVYPKADSLKRIITDLRPDEAKTLATAITETAKEAK